MSIKPSEKRIIKNLDQALFVSVCALAFLAPLVISPQVKQIFTLPKMVLIQLVTVIIFGLWLAKMSIAGGVAIAKNKTNWAAIIFLVMLVASMVTAVDKPAAIRGTYGRYEGFITLLAYVAIYFLVTQINWTPKRLLLFCKVLVIAGGVVAVYGLAQYAGFDFFSAEMKLYEANRSSSTFGNPSLLPGYLALILPPAFCLTVLAKQYYARLGYGILTLLIFSVNLTTFSRGGWLAVIIGLTLVVFLLRRRLKREKNLIAVMVVIITLAIVGIAIISSNSGRVTNLALRFRSATDFSKGSIASRLELWKSSLRMIEQKPMFGYGPDSFGLIYPKYESLRQAQSGFIADNAHNYFLQLSVTLGVFSLMAFLALIFLGLNSSRLGFRASHRGSETEQETDMILYAGLAAGVVGYMIAALSEVSVIQVNFLLWMIVGVMVGFPAPKGKFIVSWKHKALIKVAAALMLVLLVVAAAIFDLNQYRADYLYNRADNEAANRLSIAAAADYDAAIALNPYVNVYWQKKIINQSRSVTTAADLNDMKRVIEAAARANPREFMNYLGLAEINLKLYSISGDVSRLTDALNMLRKADGIRPNDSSMYYLYGLAYLYKGAPATAKYHLKRSLLISNKSARTYYNLGVAYERLGQKKQAASAYRRALALDPKLQAARDRLKTL